MTEKDIKLTDKEYQLLLDIQFKSELIFNSIDKKIIKAYLSRLYQGKHSSNSL